MRDPISWALHAANHPQHSLADMFRECQTEALEAGAEQGKCELLKIAVDVDTRISQLMAKSRQSSSAKRTG